MKFDSLSTRGCRSGAGPATHLLLAVALSCAGCASPERAEDPQSVTTKPPELRFESADLSLHLIEVLGPQAVNSLVKAPGWKEYRLDLQNLSPEPMKILDVRLLTQEGRYLGSAASYAEITAPPDPANDIAGNVAVQSAGIAAGQAIPYGGTVVGLIARALSASSAQEKASMQRSFLLRQLKNVELAPGGRVSGSAFLPDIPDAGSLVVDIAGGDKAERIEIPFGEPR